jgi:hypothetical protein
MGFTPRKSSSRAQISKSPLNTISKATDHCRRKEKPGTRRPPDHDPENKVWYLAMVMTPVWRFRKEPLHKAAHQGASVSQRTTQVSVREVRSNRDTTIAGAKLD